MERYALQLKISLSGIKPLIWRRVVVNADIDLFMHMLENNMLPEEMLRKLDELQKQEQGE